jgi:hypothetical protein
LHKSQFLKRKDSGTHGDGAGVYQDSGFESRKYQHFGSLRGFPKMFSPLSLPLAGTAAGLSGSDRIPWEPTDFWEVVRTNLWWGLSGCHYLSNQRTA